MFCTTYNTITDFIAEKCKFISPDIHFLSLHHGVGTWRRYYIEDKKVTKAQFFVENIPDFDCFIDDITNVRGTNRLTIKLGRATYNTPVKINKIVTVSDLYNIVRPGCISMTIDDGVQKRPISESDGALIKSVSIAKSFITINAKF